MNIKTKYNIGQIVYLITDEEQLGRMVTSIVVLQENVYSYVLKFGVNESQHFEIEISSEKDILKSLL